MKVFNIFPLTIVKDKIIIDENDRKILVDEIKKMKLEENNAGHTNYAWTGDTKGYEFLFQTLFSMTCHQKYQNQSKIIYKHLK